MILVLPPTFRWVAVGAFLVGVTYGLLRRRLAALAPVVFERAPRPLADPVPDRYRI